MIPKIYCVLLLQIHSIKQNVQNRKKIHKNEKQFMIQICRVS